MNESLNFSDRQTKLLLVIAVISGLAFMFIIDETLLLSIFTLASGEDFPRQGVILFDIGESDSCEYYSLDTYLPAGRDQILQENSRECSLMWNATLKVEKLEAINNSTNNPEISRLLANASREYDNRNWSEVNRVVDRLEVEKEYSVVSKNSTR